MVSLVSSARMPQDLHASSIVSAKCREGLLICWLSSWTRVAHFRSFVRTLNLTVGRCDLFTIRALLFRRRRSRRASLLKRGATNKPIVATTTIPPMTHTTGFSKSIAAMCIAQRVFVKRVMIRWSRFLTRAHHARISVNTSPCTSVSRRSVPS